MYPELSIKIMQVLHGDAICIRFLGDDGTYHNIFVDGGFVSTYARTLKKETQRIIQANERIALCVLTHTDQDHIGGALRFVKEYGRTNLVERYWFNFSNLGIDLEESGKISIADGILLRDYLKQSGNATDSDITDEKDDLDLYGATVVVLSPSRLDLENYKTLWQAFEQARNQEERIASGDNDYARSIDQLSNNPFVEDKQPENKASIAFLLRVRNRSALLLADSCPSTIVRALKQRGYSQDNRLNVDVVKLAHHASKLSTNDELFSLIECYTFIVSANGKNRYHLPHKEAIARIINNSNRDLSKPIRLIFNYDNDVVRQMFSDNEKAQYSFSCLYPGPKEYGYTVHL